MRGIADLLVNGAFGVPDRAWKVEGLLRKALVHRWDVAGTDVVMAFGAAGGGIRAALDLRSSLPRGGEHIGGIFRKLGIEGAAKGHRRVLAAIM